jgi:hypothetical protein
MILQSKNQIVVSKMLQVSSVGGNMFRSSTAAKRSTPLHIFLLVQALVLLPTAGVQIHVSIPGVRYILRHEGISQGMLNLGLARIS